MNELAWRVEEACFNGCPSPRGLLLRDRWMVRIAGGPTRRVNSGNPLRADTYDPHSVIDAAAGMDAASSRP